jgi:hypothetical protein
MSFRHLVRQNSGGHTFLVSQHGHSPFGFWSQSSMPAISAAGLDANAEPSGPTASESAIKTAKMVRIGFKYRGSSSDHLEAYTLPVKTLLCDLQFLMTAGSQQSARNCRSGVPQDAAALGGTDGSADAAN